MIGARPTADIESVSCNSGYFSQRRCGRYSQSTVNVVAAARPATIQRFTDKHFGNMLFPSSLQAVQALKLYFLYLKIGLEEVDKLINFLTNQIPPERCSAKRAR